MTTELVVGARLGDFTLLRLLGRGGQGQVFEARQVSLGRLVALKVLPSLPDDGKKRLQRFRREAEAGGRLRHPAIVAVHAVGEADGVHYIAQELVPGGRTLAHLLDDLRRRAELPADWWRRVAGLFAEVADALATAHAAGVVHRDVKPGNILLTEEGRPKVADFGLALVEDDLQLSFTGELSGTPYYMSPEQAAGARDQVDTRSDLFSLGSTLYEGLTLSRPFDGGGRAEVLRRVMLDEPVDPRRRSGGVPRDLAVICLKALEKRPDQRYASAAELAADLRRYLSAEPILARPASPWTRVAKWSRRHPVVSVAGSVAALAFVVVTFLLFENRQARLDAEREQRTAESVVSMLEYVFAGTEPLGLSGGRSSQREVLDRGVEVLASLSDQPEARWHVMLVLGAYYRNLGFVEQAAPLLDEALALAEDLSDAPDDRLAMSLLEAGRQRQITGEWAEAERLYLRCQELRGRLAAEEADATLPVLAELGMLERQQGRLVEAEQHLRSYLEACRTSPVRGGRHAETVLAAYGLALVLLDAGDVDEAAPLLDEALVAGPDVLAAGQMLRLRHTRARLLAEQGRRLWRAGRGDEARTLDTEAELVYREVLAASRAALPEGDVELAKVQANLGAFLRQRQRLDEARPLLLEALAGCRRTAGEDDVATLYVRNNLAALDLAAGDAAAAEAGWRVVLEVDRRLPRGDLEPVVSALHNLAGCLWQQGRLEEADALAEEAVARTSAQDPWAESRRTMLEEIRRFRGP